MIRKIIIIGFVLFLFDINAYPENGESIQWQRIDLESKMRQRLSEFLSLIVDKDKYFVEVQISASSPNLTLPKFEMPKEKKEKVIQGVKFTDEKNEKTRDNAEYILFDKIGILSPLFEREASSSKIDKELQVKFYQYREKMERELISKYDLFGLITNVDITLAFDTKMKDEKIEEIKKLVEKVVPKIGDINAKIEVFKMEFYEKIGKENKKSESMLNDKKKVEKSPLELAKENIPYLTGPVGTIIATVFVCLSAFVIFAGFKKHQSSLAQISGSGQSQNEDGPSDIDKSVAADQVDPDFRPGSPQLIEAISTEKEGVKKLFLYLEKSNGQACNLIKKWINLDSSLSNATLLVLSERMSIDELYKVFDKLTNDERESWIKVSSSHDIKQDLKQQADGFIAQQVMEDIMSVSATDDNELQKLLVELTPLKGAEISQANSDHGAILVNLMSSNFLAQMYLQLSTDEISEISLKGLKLNNEAIEEKTNEVKELLKKHVVHKYTNPFSRRYLEVIADLDPMRQENMLNALLEENKFFIIKDIVKKIIPINIIEKLPSEINKELAKSISKELRLEYIVSLEDDMREKYIESITQEGTKGREVLDFEVGKMLEDEISVARIKKKSDDIKADYIIEVRNALRSNSDLNIQVMDIVDDWISTLNENTNQNETDQEAA